ncbi:hypothetical protein HHK36_007999 [Tetracentron sinense]|uniref:Cytochrome P450 n=1 Tax=Tetracentron sinense TaxID=13715 RepID=A0A834ZLM7_TETSI|nr:hypothetical protein HHK36_007999 [Tetracentron sinense]
MASFTFIHLVGHTLTMNRKNTVLVYWPIVGMIPSLLRNINRLHDWSVENLRKSRGTFLFSSDLLTIMDTVVTCDPANLNHILNTNFSNFPKGSEFYDKFDFLGNGIFNADLDSWKLQRHLAHTHLTSPKFRRYLAKTSREIMEKGLLPVLSNVTHLGRVIDLQDVLLRFTFDSSCALIWGINPRCLSIDFPVVPLQRAMDDAEEAIFARYTVPSSVWMALRWLNLGMEKKLAKARATVDHFIAKYISNRREEQKESKVIEEEKDFLTFFMESKLEEEMDRMKYEKFLRDATLNLFIASRGTTSATLTWFFWLVSINPNVETKILDELKQNSPKTKDSSEPRVYDTTVLNRLVFLHASLLETLRLYPPVPFDQKGVKCQEVLPSGHEVRPGNLVLYSIYAMGRMEWIWGEDCSEFKPERWISEKGRLKFEPPCKFLAFNAGPRICLGKDMALTQMKAIAATVLYNFHFEVLEGHPIAPRTALLLFMKHGLKVRVKEQCV